MITDIHTHNPDAKDAILNINPGDDVPQNRPFSCGIHPWATDRADNDTFALLRQTLSHPGAVAIGETGIDPMRGAPRSVQTDIFIRHIRLSESLGLPVILHSVRSWQEILNLRREQKATQPWIFHGFRLKPEAALRLIEAGIIPSFGIRYNPESIKMAYPDHFLLETDDFAEGLHAVARQIAETLGTDTDEVLRHAALNASRIFKNITQI